MKFVAYERTSQGTGASRRLRLADKVPGIVYGAGEPTKIELDHNALFFALKKEAFHSSILEMELGGKTEQVLLRDHQVHAFKPIVMHIDFQRIDASTRIVKKVPLHFVNEETSPAVKVDQCTISHVVTELEIECLAARLPEFITVDLGGLNKGESVHVRDLQLDAGIKVMRRGRTLMTLASALAPQAEEEEVAPVVPVAAAPAPTKAKKTEKQNKK